MKILTVAYNSDYCNITGCWLSHSCNEACPKNEKMVAAKQNRAR